MHRTVWTAATIAATTESKSCDVIPWLGLRTRRVRPSKDLFINGQRAADATTDRIDAQFGFAKHHTREAKRAFIPNTL
jgi:hypothetical protein